MPTHRRHAMPFGAEIAAGGTRFRLWAPAAGAVALAIEGASGEVLHPMAPAGDGWFALHLAGVGAGTRYRFAIDGGQRVPDPASRFQPDDVHGASEVIDPAAFPWPDGDWRGRPWEDAVLYELHVGSFTTEGSYAGVASRLDRLADLGVTAIELMPLSEAPGGRNWGYDGCYPFAPEARYGRPEELKSLVAAAHARGLMVLLDVVYNHFGPEGNYLGLYAPRFFTERHHTPWGAAIDFTEGGRPVRDFFIENALYWLEEFRLDGLRLDAVHAIFDDSPHHILAELAERVHDRFDAERPVQLVLENDNNDARWLERRSDGRPRWYVAQWNDDFHHALHVLATGEAGGYYEDYTAAPVRALGRSLAEGFAYQGEASPHRDGAARGVPSAHLPPTAFIDFLQNHDQIGNHAFGERIGTLASADAMLALIAIYLLAPSPPMLFMGEEWDAPQVFPFFCDFRGALGDAVRDGRRREFAKFPAFRDETARQRIPDPLADATFASAVLDWAAAARPEGRARRDYYRALLALRAREIVPRLRGIGGQAGRFTLEGAAGLRVAWGLADGAELTLLANLGPVPLSLGVTPPPGRLLFTTHPAIEPQGVAWPAWYVAWRIAP